MTDAELAALVRRADPDRFIGALFAPPERRRWLLTLYAFNHELARAREVAHSAPLALIRLHWWREVVEGAKRDHPVANLVREAIGAGALDPVALAALVDAREAEAEPIAGGAAFMAYVRGTAGGLGRMAGRCLGVDDAAGLGCLDDLGTGYGIVAILRAGDALRAHGRVLLPEDAGVLRDLPDIARVLLANRPPRAAIAAALPAVLARRDLRRVRRGDPMRPRSLGDRLAVIAAGLSGRM
jgi:Phytoene/squalene synthetase